MTYTYCLKKRTVHDEKRKPYIVYGIEAVGSDGEVVVIFSDMFSDKRKAEYFVNLFNSGGLSLSHFADAVEDALAE